MGEISDYYIEKQINKGFDVEQPSERKFYWTTANGEKHEINTMKSGHILNCMHLCERRETGGAEFLDKAPTYRHMVDTLISRGYLTKHYYDMTLEERKR